MGRSIDMSSERLHQEREFVNPYESPSAVARKTHILNNKKSPALKFFLLAMTFLTIASVFLAVGLAHYQVLSQQYDPSLQDSRVHARITEPALYWLIPVGIGLLIALLCGSASLVLFLARVFRRR